MAFVSSSPVLREFAEREWLRPDLARATRATAGFMIPLVLQATMALPVEVTFASITAQSIAMLDMRGDYRVRISLLAGMTCLLAASGALGTLASGQLLLAVAATMIVAFGAALWRHVGSDYGPALGAASMLLCLLSLAASHGPGDTLRHGASILAGGAIGVGIQMILWPLRPQHPLRRAVSDSWVAAGALFATLQPGGRPGEINDAEAALRTTLDQTRAVLIGVNQRYRTPLRDRLDTLNSQAARLAARVGAVHTALDNLHGASAHPELAPALGSVLSNLTNTARSVAVTVVSRQPSHLAACEVRLRRLDALLEALLARAAGRPGTAALVPLIEGVRASVPEVSAALQATLDRAGERALFTLELFDVETWQLRPLASAINLNRHIDRSLLLFGARLAIFTGLGTLIHRWFDIPHGYWLPFTVVVVMQPDFGSTRQKALQRVGGTLAGSVAASLLIWLKLAPAAYLLLIALGVFGFAYFLKRRYGLAVFFATIFVVMLLEHAGQGGPGIELERIGATIGGGVMALAAAQLFWPVWERHRFPPLFARALISTKDYFASLQTHLRDGTGASESLIQAKRQAEAASAEVFASLGRLFADTRAPREEVEKIATLANGNQRMLRLANLILVGLKPGQPLETPLVNTQFSAVARTLDYLAVTTTEPARETPVLSSSPATELDTLPPPPADSPEYEGLTCGYLARAANEIRAMLAANSKNKPGSNYSVGR